MADLTYPHDAVSLYAYRILESYLKDKDPIFIPPYIQPYFTSSGDGPAQADVVGGQDSKVGPMLPIFSKNKKVAIVGAGIGGLYAALILQYHEIPFDIFDMDNKVGGRLKTHHFSEEENDYYVCETFNLWLLSN